MTRRAFLISGGVLGGGIILGYFFTPNRLALHGGAPRGAEFLATWVRISPDGEVTVLVPHAEMGQGTHTALAMMLAEELDADWSRVRVEQAPAEGVYAVGDLVRGFGLGDAAIPAALLRHADYAAYRIADLLHMQITGGSASVRFTGQFGMRRAGAAARELLVGAAAARWDVEVSECRTESGRVMHASSGRSAGYGELAEAAARGRLSAHPRLKDRAAYRICGTALARVDIPTHVSGRAVFGIDVRLPEMKFAAIRHAPVFGGAVVSCDASAVLRNPGIRKVVTLHDAVAVIADSFWQAKTAIDSLPVEFDDGANAQFDTNAFEAELQLLLETGPVKNDRIIGRPLDVLASSPGVVEAIYAVPFLAHATMEPPNCTAWLRDGRLDLWAGTQDLLGARAVAARTAGLDIDRVTAHAVPLGGGFGRRLPTALNFIEDAVRVAMQLRHPVQLIWTREEDIQHDLYRPAVRSRFRATLGPDGLPQVWDHVYADIGLNDDRSAAFIPYGIPHQRIGRVTHASPVPLGYWRSVEHSAQTFFRESFVDELATQAGMDPLEYRMRLLGQSPRLRAVLSRAAQLIGWNEGPRSAGTGIGVAVAECFGSVVAEAARVGMTETGHLDVERVAVVADPGEVINPDIARAQLEGGVVFGLGAALFGRISLERGRVAQSNFADYGMPRLADTPDIIAELVESGAPIGGLGEVGVPALAPALCNAICSATRKRVRRLPVLDAERRLAP